jgi:cobalt-zinc-cadmium efflux system protein
VVVEDAVLSARGADQVLDKLATCLGSHFDTEHCTFQLEPESHSEHESHQHA